MARAPAPDAAPAAAPNAAGAPAYGAAIEHTARVVARRGGSFRNQVVAVTLVGVAVLALAAVTGSPRALAGLLLLVPTIGAFAAADGHTLRGWRSAMLAHWIGHGVALSALRTALRAHPGLPQDTVGAMLATLPPAEDVVEEQRIDAPTRRAVAAASAARDRAQLSVLELTVAASALAVGAVVTAVWTRAWSPLAALAGLAFAPATGAWIRRRGRIAQDAVRDAYRGVPGFSEADYDDLLATRS